MAAPASVVASSEIEGDGISGFSRNEHARDALEIIGITNELRDLLGKDVLKIPLVVSFGDQSVGKSSVLESIIRYDILPRGSGTCTRCPIEVRLQPDASRWAKFLKPAVDCQYPLSTLAEQHAVGKEISKHMTLLAGGPKKDGKCVNVVGDPVILEVHGPDLPPLTVVDLPGLTHADPEGMPGLSSRILETCMERVNRPEAIVMCVHKGDNDLQTSKAFDIMKKSDSSGKRTIGVITFCNSNPYGSAKQIIDTIENKIIRLVRGWVGVVNRNQQHHDQSKDSSFERKFEEEFFSTNEHYRDYFKKHKNAFGSPQLVEKLTFVLLEAVREALPEYRSILDSRIRGLESERGRLGEGPPKSEAEMISRVSNRLGEYTKKFEGLIHGTDFIATLPSGRVVPGGRAIKRVFLEEFKTAVMDTDVMEGLKGADVVKIDEVIKNSEGIHLSSLSAHAFELLIRPRIEFFRPLIVACITSVYELMIELAEGCIESVCGEEMPNLGEKIRDALITGDGTSVGMFKSVKDVVDKKAMHLLDIESGYIFTNSESFRAMMLQAPEIDPFEERIPEDVDDTTLLNRIKMMNWMTEYYNIVKKNLLDMVPKCIGHFLVQGIIDRLNTTLLHKVQNKTDVALLVQEKPDLHDRRSRLEDELERCLKAKNLLMDKERYIQRFLSHA